MTPAPRRFYVVLPDRGRVPGIYDEWGEAEAQILGYSRGQAKRFPSLDLARVYWSEAAPGIDPDLYLVHSA